MNSSGIEHLKDFGNTVKNGVVASSDVFRVQQSCHLEYSFVQRRLIIYNLKETPVKFIIMHVEAKPFVHNKKHRWQRKNVTYYNCNVQ
jgi:hypothetical protein